MLAITQDAEALLMWGGFMAVMGLFMFIMFWVDRRRK